MLHHPSELRPNSEAFRLIKKFTPLKLVPELVNGSPSIGWGTRCYPPHGTFVTLNDRHISISEADYLFRYDCDMLAKELRTLIERPCHGRQFAAILSFTHDVGIGTYSEVNPGFTGSLLRERINAGASDADILIEWRKWDERSKDRVNAECELWLDSVAIGGAGVVARG
jgi:GH24 family phage-related lysozyme (muramidase)